MNINSDQISFDTIINQIKNISNIIINNNNNNLNIIN